MAWWSLQWVVHSLVTFPFVLSCPFPMFRCRDRKINSCPERRSFGTSREGEQWMSILWGFICIYSHPQPGCHHASVPCLLLGNALLRRRAPRWKILPKGLERECSNIYSEMGFASPTPLFKWTTKQEAIRNHKWEEVS